MKNVHKLRLTNSSEPTGDALLHTYMRALSARSYQEAMTKVGAPPKGEEWQANMNSDIQKKKEKRTSRKQQTKKKP